MSPSRRVSPTTCKLDVGPLPSTPTPRLPVVVSITVFDEAPTNVIVSTLLKSSVPWGVAMGIVSTMEGGFFKLGKAVGRNKSCGLGTLVLTKWEALWRKRTSDVSLGRGWPNGVFRIFGRCGKVAESLAIVQPLLFLFGGGMGKIDGHVLIRLVEEGVPLFAEFL